MKKKTAIFLIIALVAPILLIVALQRNGSESNEPDGSDLVALGSSLIPFDKALPQLNAMLNGNTKEQLQALASIQSRPHLVKDLPIFNKIVTVAITGEDYQLADAALKELEGNEDALITLDEQVLELGARSEVRELALLIAVANGSPEAISVANKLKDSQSPTEQRIASLAQRWLDLYGTQDAPQPPPLIYRTKLVPFSTFLDNVSSDLATGNPEREQIAIDSVERSFATKVIPSDSRDKLIAVLAEFADANITNNAAKSNLQSISRAAFFAGGPASKQLLIRISQSTDGSVSEGANSSLRDFDEFHSGKK